MTPEQLKALVRTVPDFPAPGILFRDITTLISHGAGLAASIGHLARMAQAAGAEAIAGMEARGFIFGAAVAAHMGLGFVPVRKPGKLPVETIGIDYALEYGRDRLEIDPTAIPAGQRVVIIDDLIATGGTALAAAELLRMVQQRDCITTQPTTVDKDSHIIQIQIFWVLLELMLMVVQKPHQDL